MDLQAGDFVLLPATPSFTMSGFEPATPTDFDPLEIAAAPDSNEVRDGRQHGPPDVRQLGGYFEFQSPDAALLVPLLPTMIHVRGAERLSLLVRLVGEEAMEERSGRDLVLSRLIEILLVEALRSEGQLAAAPGLLRGLADEGVARAMRSMHAELAHPWTVAELAKSASMSRSAFAERFTRTVGMAPREYLLTWRMAVAKDLLSGGGVSMSEVAERVGYSSASAFSTAFARHVGQPPRALTRAHSSV